MPLSKHPQRKAGKTTPPLLIGLAGLVIAVGFACFLGLTAIQNEKVTRDAVTGLQTMWDERIASHTSIDQDKTEIEVQQDRLKLAAVTDSYRQLHQLISVSAVGLVIFSLLCFIGFRFGLLLPLRKLEDSSRKLLENDLNGHIWGLDRDDAFGSLARSISDIRKATVSISDMVVQTENGEQHVRFEGRSGAVFGALISDLQKTVEQLTQHSATLETVSKEGQESIKSLGNVTTEQTQNVESALSSISDKLTTTNDQWNEQFANIHAEWKAQLANTHQDWSERLSTLFHQNNQIQGQSKQMVDQFTRDMYSLNQIAGATGARVAQTLQILGTTDRDIKKAAQQSLEASTTFSKQANELMEKLQAATNLLRASGKVMSETTESTRTRLNEAINSVSSHDQAIRAFLGDTEEKTDRITSLLEDVSRSAIHASETVSTFDSRMAQFEEKSNTAFNRIDASGDAIGTASSQLTEAHSMMQGSLESMNGHTEMLARILTSIRDEYASFSDEWKNNLAETTPVIAQLKEASDGLQTQLHDEWTVYARQSRELLTALEQDVRAMNGRTEMVTQDTEKLIAHLSEQTQRIGDNANHFDLQIANISMRLDDATTNMLNSNKVVVENTTTQIKTIHTSVQDMAQRLSILSQLTGTLGAVAGQLGQIVPNLGSTMGDAQHMQRMPAAIASADPAVLARFEEISAGFTNTVDNIKGEFDGVRDQIGRWVQMLTGGYKNLAEQIAAVDGSIDEKITSLQQQIESATAAQITAAAAIASSPPPVPPINLGEELVPAMRLIHEGLEKGYAIDTLLSNDLQKLKADLQAMAKDVQNTTHSLQNLGTQVETGFERIDAKESKPVAVTVDASRVETAAQALDQLLKKLQGHSDTVVGKLGAITQRLEGTSTKLQQVRFDAPTHAAADGQVATTPQTSSIAMPLIEFSEKANLDQLQQQIEHISTMLDQFSADGTGFINPMGEQEALTPDKSKAFIDTVMATIIRLHHIAESIEKIGGSTPPSGGQDSKTG
ncbi:MAG: hypothetical protein K2Q32_01580 [Alphaproteobacteria bacterium]|nr:hypothetical protein [Alphaproteobacteria bacterium]